jgi:hypothetical protein
MSKAASSTGPGIGRTAKAASPRSGLGMRPSRERIPAERIRRRAPAVIALVTLRPAWLALGDTASPRRPPDVEPPDQAMDCHLGSHQGKIPGAEAHPRCGRHERRPGIPAVVRR